jgi:hypothetical protein
MPLYLRVPVWASSATILVNGKPQVRRDSEQSLLFLERTCAFCASHGSACAGPTLILGRSAVLLHALTPLCICARTGRVQRHHEQDPARTWHHHCGAELEPKHRCGVVVRPEHPLALCVLGCLLPPPPRALPGTQCYVALCRAAAWAYVCALWRTGLWGGRYGSTASVVRGPLLFSLNIPGNYSVVASYAFESKDYQVLPLGEWRYALEITDPTDPAKDFSFVREPFPEGASSCCSVAVWAMSCNVGLSSAQRPAAGAC